MELPSNNMLEISSPYNFRGLWQEFHPSRAMLRIDYAVSFVYIARCVTKLGYILVLEAVFCFFLSLKSF